MGIEFYKIQPNNCSGLEIIVKKDDIAGETMDRFISLLLHPPNRKGRKTKEQKGDVKCSFFKKRTKKHEKTMLPTHKPTLARRFFRPTQFYFLTKY